MFWHQRICVAQTLRKWRHRQASVDADLNIARQFDAILRALHAPLQPIADRAIFDMHELHANAAAVGILEFCHQVAQRAAVDVLEGRA